MCERILAHLSRGCTRHDRNVALDALNTAAVRKCLSRKVEYESTVVVGFHFEAASLVGAMLEVDQWAQMGERVRVTAAGCRWRCVGLEWVMVCDAKVGALMGWLRHC